MDSAASCDASHSKRNTNALSSSYCYISHTASTNMRVVKMCFGLWLASYTELRIVVHLLYIAALLDCCCGFTWCWHVNPWTAHQYHTLEHTPQKSSYVQ